MVCQTVAPPHSNHKRLPRHAAQRHERRQRFVIGFCSNMMCHDLTISNPFLAGSFTSTNPGPLINEGLKHSRYCASDTCAARQRHRTLTTNVYLAMQHKNDKGLSLVALAFALALALAHLMLNHVNCTDDTLANQPNLASTVPLTI